MSTFGVRVMLPLIGLARAKDQRRQHDVQVGLAVAAGPPRRFVGDVDVVAADDDGEIAAGVDVAAAALRPSDGPTTARARPTNQVPTTGR